MLAIEKKNFSAEIVSIDPFSQIAYTHSFRNSTLIQLDQKQKNAFIISYLHTRDVISSTIDINHNIQDSDIKDAIEIKIYDELALDSSVEYIINYIETESKDINNRSFNIFLIDTKLLQAKFLPIKEKIHYIDYITTAPFLIKALYRKNFLSMDETHCFIYFQKSDAFLAVYKNGEYIYSKSLHYSLHEMNEKFCELLGERIDEESFYTLLIQEGLKATNSQYQQHLLQLFNDIYLYLSEILVFTKRSYNIDYIDKIYIGSEIGSFGDILEFTKNHLGIETSKFDFSTSNTLAKEIIDQMHLLMMLSAQLYIENPDDHLNFSIFKRPPPLQYRASGKFLGVIAASVVISLIYPTYQFFYNSFLHFQSSRYSNAYNELFIQTSGIKQDLALLKTEKEKIDGLIASETTKFEFRKKLLVEIYNKKISYTMKTSMLLEIFSLSNKNDCKIEDIDFKKNQLNVSVRNKNEKKITEFIQDLSALNKYKINTDKILQDDKIQLYTSKITIGLANE